MKLLVPVTLELPLEVLFYFSGLEEKTHVRPAKAMSALLSSFVEVQGETLLRKLREKPFIDLDTSPTPHQNN